MPITLWRHLLIELTKMLLATAGIIVTVIAFGFAAKPLAENLIGPELVFKFVAIATVPMLQYALPFSAGFAATVVLHRFVSDNEITAMSANGMSYGRIIAPIAILGGILTVVVFMLVSYIGPRYLTKLDEMATADVTEILVAAVNRGEALETEKLLVYADSVESVDPPAGSGAIRRLLLRGVAAIEIEKRSAAPQTEFTAEAAAIDVYATDRGTIAKIALLKATIFRPSEGAIATVPYAEPEATGFSRPHDRGPKYLPLGELIALRQDVDRSSDVRDARAVLEVLLTEVGLWQCIATQFEQHGSIRLDQPLGGRSLLIEGARLSAGGLVPASTGGVVRITELANGKAIRRTEAARAQLKMVAEVGFRPTVSLIVATPIRTTDLVQNTPVRWPPRIDDLTPVECQSRDWSLATSDECIAAANNLPVADARIPVADFAKRVADGPRRIDRARNDVRSESDSHLLQRAAQTVSVGLVLMLGAVLAMWLKRALPLTIYLLAFMPAIGNIMCIGGGQQMIRDGFLTSGSVVMWSGNAMLAASLLWAWSRLVKN